MKKPIIIVLVVLLLAGLALLLLFKGGGVTDDPSAMAVEGDPMDATLDFYSAWHDAVMSTSTDPLSENLLEHPRLSDEVRTYITDALAADTSGFDPVLCQSEVPPRIGTRASFALDTQAEVHVLSRGLAEKSAQFAVVKLTGVNGEWQITNIDCSSGETAPEREHTFDREGFLLKNVPEPLNSDYWHLVFEEDGVQGHTAPLFFDESSVCVALDGTETTCDESTFVGATKAHVQGEMTEAGVNVVRVTMLP